MKKGRKGNHPLRPLPICYNNVLFKLQMVTYEVMVYICMQQDQVALHLSELTNVYLSGEHSNVLAAIRNAKTRLVKSERNVLPAGQRYFGELLVHFCLLHFAKGHNKW